MTDAINDILSGGAFSRQQATALRQLLATLTGYDPAGTADAAVTAHEAALNPHPGYLTETEADALYAPIGVDTDPWSHAVLASDQAYSGGITEANLAGLSFTPAANTKYLIRFVGSWTCSTTNSSNNFVPGVSWPTGLTSGSLLGNVASTSSSVRVTASAGSTFNGGNVTPAATNTPYPAIIDGMLVAGASPSGAFQLRIKTNSAGSHVVTMLAGSTLSWRELP